MNDRKWDSLIAARLYATATFIILPTLHICIQLKRIQPTGAVILGFAAWLILKFVLFEPRTASKRFLNVSIAFLIPASCLIFVNFLIGFFIDAAHENSGGVVLTLCIVAGTPLYFAVMLFLRPLRGLNARAASLKSGGGFFKRNALEVALVLWVLVSALILALPYRTHMQAAPATAGPTRLGFWTGDQFFNKETASPEKYVSDEMLRKFGENGVYLVYSGIRENEIGEILLRDFTRCKKFGVEVNIAFSASFKDYSYVNIWTFENLTARVEKALAFLDANGLIGDPVTTLVYDMEAPEGKFFPHYGYDRDVVANLPDYYRVQKLFREFNRHVMEDYGLKVRICAETNQAFDFRDGDDDLTALYGVMSDEKVLMSYMIYRRGDFAENYVADSARYLKKGDTIILNSWKEEGYQCRGDADCAINEARIAAGYPGKNYGVEVWALCHFIDSHGKDGLFKFVDAVTGDKSAWPPSEVRNRWRSHLWDLALTAISTLDIYAPLFRATFHAY